MFLFTRDNWRLYSSVVFFRVSPLLFITPCFVLHFGHPLPWRSEYAFGFHLLPHSKHSTHIGSVALVYVPIIFMFGFMYFNSSENCACVLAIFLQYSSFRKVNMVCIIVYFSWFCESRRTQWCQQLEYRQRCREWVLGGWKMIFGWYRLR